MFAGIQRQPGVVYVALVPNLKGAERAVAAGADEVNLVMSASETHNRANMRMSYERSLAAIRRDRRGRARHRHQGQRHHCDRVRLPVRRDAVDQERVLGIAQRYLEIGVDGITLADTTGMANPRQVAQLVAEALLLISRDC